jgi:exopolyphosphatase/guanosine-5'-triphosphate,3'-diphosphate pyrophosphatase
VCVVFEETLKMMDYYAAIDFGTNTARLLIAALSAGRLTPVRIEREVVRLGGGFTHESGLSSEASDRGLSCLYKFSKIISEYSVCKVFATATSAVRDAVNGPAFVDEVLNKTGIKLVVIDGEVEACLTLRGVLSGLDTQCTSLVVLDVGGGSTEFLVSDHGSPIFIKSMPIGVVRLTEGFKTREEMVKRIRTVIDKLEYDLLSAGVTFPGDCAFVGTAGTATTLAAIKLEMVEYDYKIVNNFTLSFAEISEIYERLERLSPQERLLIKGLEKGREDLIVAGLLMIISVMDRFGFDLLKVSDFGLLEGLALSGSESGGFPDLQRMCL